MIRLRLALRRDPLGVVALLIGLFLASFGCYLLAAACAAGGWSCGL